MSRNRLLICWYTLEHICNIQRKPRQCGRCSHIAGIKNILPTIFFQYRRYVNMTRQRRERIIVVNIIAVIATLFLFRHDWKYDHPPSVVPGSFFSCLLADWPAFILYWALISLILVLFYYTYVWISNFIRPLFRQHR